MVIRVKGAVGALVLKAIIDDARRDRAPIYHEAPAPIYHPAPIYRADPVPRRMVSAGLAPRLPWNPPQIQPASGTRHSSHSNGHHDGNSNSRKYNWTEFCIGGQTNEGWC